MPRTYEYWTIKDKDDYVINLTVTSSSARKGNFSSQAMSAEEYFGHREIEWETKDDISHLSKSELADMEEWLTNEHFEFLADEACCD